MHSRRIITLLLAGIGGATITASSILCFETAGLHPPAATAAMAGEEDDQQRIVAAVKHVEPSVVALDVSINGTRILPTDPFNGMLGPGFGEQFFSVPGLNNQENSTQITPFRERASGSGFVYSRSGLILTNDHVIHNASSIQVVFANGDKVPGHIYSENAGADLALVKVDHYAKLPPPVDLGSSKQVEQGEWAIAIGEPYALKQTVTVGVVSGFNRDEAIGGDGTLPREFKGLLQTSAPINPGNSGGPLVDLDGRVIGVNQSVERPAQDIGFAIPVDAVKKTVALLATHPGPATAGSTGFIGVQLERLDNDLRSTLGYTGNGVAIASVIGGSPADNAGLTAGDVIQSVNGNSVKMPEDVSKIVRKLAPGHIASMHVWNNGTRELVAVHVGAAPTQAE